MDRRERYFIYVMILVNVGVRPHYFTASVTNIIKEADQKKLYTGFFPFPNLVSKSSHVMFTLI